MYAHNAGIPQGTSLDEQVIGTFASFPADETRTVRYHNYDPDEIEHGKSCSTLAANNDLIKFFSG